MKFFDCETAPSPRRVRIFIAEKGIEIETVQIDLGAGEQFGEEFRKINPDCVVPVLQLDDGSYLSEVLAICSYLEAKYPQPALFGDDDEERARILMWNCKVEQQGVLAVGEAFRNHSKGFRDRAATGPVGYAQIPELAIRGRARIEQFVARLNDQLAGNEYVAGSRYSIADITALVTMDFAAWIKFSIPTDATNVQRWYDSVSGRSSASV